MKEFKITVTEEQLRLIAQCVEDCHRFAGGQMELQNTTSLSENYCELSEKLRELQPLMTPYLPFNASYGWNGGDCPNKHQKSFMAKTYAIYREIYHQLRKLDDTEDKGYSVYDSPTLTCGEPLPKIEKVKNGKKSN